MGRIIDRRRVYCGGGNHFIEFADPAMKAACVALWGGADGGTAPLSTRVNNVKVTGVDGELTYEQAASIKNIATDQFRSNTTITSFDELQYFTGLTTIGTNAFLYCSRLTSINIPSGVTSIGDYAFAECSRLISANIPNGVTIIRSAVFRDCTRLASINIPDRVTIIAGNAFRNTSIQEVLICSSVTSIGSLAFDSCTKLAQVTILAVTPPTLETTNVFTYNKAGRKIYVPAESVEAYKSAANWSTYAADIEAIPT